MVSPISAPLDQSPTCKSHTLTAKTPAAFGREDARWRTAEGSTAKATHVWRSEQRLVKRTIGSNMTVGQNQGTPG